MTKLWLVAAVCLVTTQAALPSVYTIVEDDYPYMCTCKCDEAKHVSVCEYDKATPCFCEIP
jgi:hypothetical protein